MCRNLIASAQVQSQDGIDSKNLLRMGLELNKYIGPNFEYPGYVLCQIYLQMSINHKEILQLLDNFANWPQNMWWDGDKNTIRNLRKDCEVRILFI